jgi:hypothetical protein
MTLLSELFQINEATQPVDPTLAIEEQLEILESRMAAAKRGLGFANKLKNPAQKKKHMALVLSNLNKIRGNLTRVINQMAQFDNAERDHEASMEGPGMEFDHNSREPTAGRAAARKEGDAAGWM